MYKVIVFVLLLWVNMQGFSQTLQTFSIGGGTESLHNSYLSPYNLKGARFINVGYSRDKTKEGSKWETIWDIDFGVSSLNMDFNFADKLQKGSANLAFELMLGKKYLYKLLDVSKLSISAGGSAILQSRYQVISFYPVALGEKDYDYLMCGASTGISVGANLHLKKINIRNVSSCMLLNAMLLPNYSNDLPFSGENVSRYLSFSTIGSRVYLENEFKVEFPLFIKNKLINSYSISYLINYENSECKDILYKKVSHIFTLGIIFATQRINVLSQ